MIETLKIDPEFKSLIPALSPDEYAQLEANIKSEGCRDALVVWGSTIVDGHNRYEICTKHSLPYSTVYRSFESREDAVAWICMNQIGRRNIPQFVRDELALRIKDVLLSKGKRNMSEGLSDSDKPLNTQKEVAALSKTSAGGIAQTEVILKNAPEPIKQAARSGELSRNRAYEMTRALTGASPEVVHIVVRDKVEDLQTIATLKRLQVDSANTFNEIYLSSHIQPGDESEAAHIAAGELRVQEALKAKAKTHAILAMQEKQARREELASQENERLSEYQLGDCIELAKQLAPKSVRLLLTDPPYGMDFQSNRRVISAQLPKIAGDSDIVAATSLFMDMLKAVQPALMDECHLLIFTGWRYEQRFRDLLEANGYEVAASLVWVKENHTSGDLAGFAPRHERILHARRGRLVISPRVDDVLIVPRERSTEHPTEKPTALLKTLIECTTVKGELVLDPFAGTGATVVAAQALDRRVIAFEKDAAWYGEGIERLSGKAA